MAGVFYGRKRDLRKLQREAYSSFIDNKAFFGVKGLGKSSLIRAFFTPERLADLAEKKKYLFIVSSLEHLTGEQLVRYLTDLVLRGANLIRDPEEKRQVLEAFELADRRSRTAESCLDDYLQELRAFGYTMILVMDHFQNLSGSSSVSREQYDLLRSLNDKDLVWYWIISDLDFTDQYVTEQFTTSFFSQKFEPQTLPQMTGDDVHELLKDYYESRARELCWDEDADDEGGEDELPEDARWSREATEMVYGVTGGIPEMALRAADILLDLRYRSPAGGEAGPGEWSGEMLRREMLKSRRVLGFLESWCRGLDPAQKRILLAVAEEGLRKIPITEEDIVRCNELADYNGLGLLCRSREDDTYTFTCNSELLRAYVLEHREEFLEAGKKTDIIRSEGLPGDTGDILERIRNRFSEPSGTVIVNIHGDVIGQQVKNQVFNVADSVDGLLALKQMMEDGSPSRQLAAQEILLRQPMQQEAWQEIPDEEQEAMMEEYADTVFTMPEFTNGILTEEQMAPFGLTGEILEQLSDSCRSQVVCGIQVYLLIQACIDRFHLDMSHSESPRGILLCRAFERGLKDYGAPAFRALPALGNTLVRIGGTQVRFADCDVSKSTIGNYAFVLKRGSNLDVLRNRSQALGLLNGIPHAERAQFWRDHSDNLDCIGGLRNDCCHSSGEFGRDKLLELVDRIFARKALSGMLLMLKRIGNR